MNYYFYYYYYAAVNAPYVHEYLGILISLRRALRYLHQVIEIWQCDRNGATRSNYEI